VSMFYPHVPTEVLHSSLVSTCWTVKNRRPLSKLSVLSRCLQILACPCMYRKYSRSDALPIGSCNPDGFESPFRDFQSHFPLPIYFGYWMHPLVLMQDAQIQVAQLQHILAHYL
jgi:hypothetical protein